MVKPTFMQSLLNRPTQSYTFPPPKKDYHSQKNEFVRIAQAYRDGSPAHLDISPERTRTSTSATSSISAGEGTGRSSSSKSGAQPLKLDNPTPNALMTPANDQRINVISPNEVVQNHLLRAEQVLFNSNNESDSDSDSQEDIFYTPNTSPRTSMIGQSPQILASLIPFPTPPPRKPPFIREDSVDSMTSTTATTSAADMADFDSVSADGSSHSLFSLPSTSDSTWLSTPVTSDAGHYPQPGTKRSTSPLRLALNENQSDITFNSLGSCSSHPAVPTSSPPRRSNSRTKRSSTAYVYTTPHNSSEDNWAKDVRWLVPPQSMSKLRSATPSASITSNPVPKRAATADTLPVPHSRPTPSTANGQKTLSHRRSKSLIIGSPRSLQPQAPPPDLQLQHPPPRRLQHRRSKSASVRKTKTVMSMTALVEVEEPSEVNELHHALMGRDRTRTHSLLQAPSKSQLKSQSSRSRVSSSPSTPPQTLPPQSAPSRSQYTANSRTVTLPTPLPSASTSTQNLPSSGTPGYTSLVLPRAAYPGPSKSKASSKFGFGFGVLGGGEVDLTKGGMAQTTMATVEVVRGIAKASTSGLASNSSAKTSRRKVLPMSFTMPSFLGRSPSVKGKEKVLDESPLTFTSWRKPPGYVGANGVLVQVWAVAVDSVDQTLVRGAGPSSPLPSSKKKGGNRDGESTKKADVGFVPGRSFVGRVLECGWEVREDLMKKSDWVVGLLDVKKCGAMAEFVVVDRRRLHRVPYPRMPSNSANPDIASHAHALSLEELALLPLAGIPAHRAVRTFTPVEAEATAPPRALVLRGQEGAGAMAVQMLASRGWRVSVHVPVPTRLPTLAGLSRSYTDEESRRTEYFDETEEAIRAWGAEEVIFVRQHDDDPEGRDGAVKLMERLLEEGEEFDGVLDTVGGKEVWDAGETLLTGRGRSSEAQFTTLVGDTPERIIPSTSDLFKAGLRSTKKHGNGSAAANRRLSVDNLGIDNRKTKGKAKVRYAWVIINQDVDWESEDIAESLRAVIRTAAVQDGVRPRVVGDKIVPFEKTPDVFVGGNLGCGGTFVVKVVG